MDARELAKVAKPTHEDLVRRLVEAVQRKMTAEEIFEQEVSWAYGNMPSDSKLTREDVREHLLRRRGE